MDEAMHALSLYLDTSVIGGYFDAEFMATPGPFGNSGMPDGIGFSPLNLCFRRSRERRHKCASSCVRPLSWRTFWNER